MSDNTWVIGVDGGGTRTRARLANEQGELLGSGEAGIANPNAHGYAAAQKEILDAIDRAFQDAHIEKQIVAAACLGIGGVDRADERAQFAEWARQTIAPRAQIVNDGEIVLAAGLPENWGADRRHRLDCLGQNTRGSYRAGGWLGLSARRRGQRVRSCARSTARRDAGGGWAR